MDHSAELLKMRRSEYRGLHSYVSWGINIEDYVSKQTNNNIQINN